MIKLEKLVCLVDFSSTSRLALDYAVATARKFSAELVLLHVLEEVPLLTAYAGHAELDELRYAEDAARKQLAEWIARSDGSDLKARVEVSRGPTEASIVEFCEREKADLMVMGTHGRRFLDAALFGSVAHRVIRRVACPVLLVRLPSGVAPYEPVRT
jgi:nucleotide-binding universal stress UspA family protein